MHSLNNKWNRGGQYWFLMIIRYALTQFSAKQGLNKFGEKCVNTVMEEIQQMYDMKTLKPVYLKDLNGYKIIEFLESLMLLNKKRYGRIKGYHWSDGCKQRDNPYQKYSIPPTVSTEAIFITSVIEAFEIFYVAATDIPGSFMSSNMEEVVHIKIWGELDLRMINLAPGM